MEYNSEQNNLTPSEKGNSAENMNTAGTFSPSDNTSPAENPVQTDNSAQPVNPETENSALNMPSIGGENPEKKKKAPLPAIILIAAAALIAVIFLIFRLVSGSDPSKEFIAIQRKFFEQSIVKGIKDGIPDSRSFSADIKISGEVKGESLYVEYISKLLEGSSVTLKTDANTKEYLANAILNLKEKEALKAIFYTDENKISFSIPGANENKYTIDSDKLSESRGINAEEGRNLRKAYEKLYDVDLNKVTDSIFSIYAVGVNDKNLVVERNVKIQFSEIAGELTGSVYTWNPQKEDCKNMLLKMADVMKTDDEIVPIISDIVDVYSKLGVYDGSSVSDSIDEYVRYINENIDELAEKMEKANITVILGIDKSKKLVKYSIEFNNDGVANLFAFETKKDGSNTSSAVYIEEDGMRKLKLSNEMSMDNKMAAGTFNIQAASRYGAVNIPVKYSVDYNRKSELGIPYGNYVADFSQLGVSVKLALDVQEAGNGSTDHLIRISGLSSIFSSYNAIESAGIFINSSTPSTAEKPSGTEIDVSSYSDEELSELFRGLIKDAAKNSPELSEILSGLF